MNQDQWAKLIQRSGGQVRFANPAFGTSQASRYEDHVLISFPRDQHIEVQWDSVRRKYRVTLSVQKFDTVIAELHCDSRDAVLDAVRELSFRASRFAAGAQVRAPGTSDDAVPIVEWPRRSAPVLA